LQSRHDAKGGATVPGDTHGAITGSSSFSDLIRKVLMNSGDSVQGVSFRQLRIDHTPVIPSKGFKSIVGFIEKEGRKDEAVRHRYISFFKPVNPAAVRGSLRTANGTPLTGHLFL